MLGSINGAYSGPVNCFRHSDIPAYCRTDIIHSLDFTLLTQQFLYPTCPNPLATAIDCPPLLVSNCSSTSSPSIDLPSDIPAFPDHPDHPDPLRAWCHGEACRDGRYAVTAVTPGPLGHACRSAARLPSRRRRRRTRWPLRAFPLAAADPHAAIRRDE
jgi:hypothetical protein